MSLIRQFTGSHQHRPTLVHHQHADRRDAITLASQVMSRQPGTLLTVRGLLGPMGAECDRFPSVRCAALLMLLMLFASLSPLAGISQLADDSEADLPLDIIRAHSVSFNSGYGEQLAGDEFVINASDWTVEARRGLDDWIVSAINITASSVGHLDLARDDRGRARGCAHIPGQGLMSVKLEFGSGAPTSSMVEEGSGTLGGACSIAIDERESVHIAYIDENQHVSIARETYEYEWHVRTIEDSITVTDPVKLLLRSNPGPLNGAEIILYRDATAHTLHMSDFTTTYWQHSQLLQGQTIGADFDAYLDSDDNIHLLYVDTDTNELRTAMWNSSGGPYETVVDSGSGIGSALSFQADAITGTEQFAFSNGSGTLRIVRDLTGQEDGRLDPAPTELTTGNSDNEYANQAFSTVDLNCDGISDMVVSEPAANGAVGEVHIWYGSTGGISSAPSSTLGGTASGDRFGHSTAPAGDVNGDGCDDLAVGAPGQMNTNSIASGMVHVFHGKTGGVESSASWTAEGDSNGDKFGGTVASAGDVNNDGYDDLLVAATGWTSGPTRAGQIYLYDGGANGLNTSGHSWTRDGSGTNLVLGFTMAGVGDANNDGFDDVAIASTRDFSDLSGYSRVQIYHGSASGLPFSYAQEWAMDRQSTLFGRILAPLGDINGDNYDDLAVGEPLNDSSSGASSAGKVWIFTGSSTGFSKNPALEIEGEVAGQLFGSAIAAVGDINDDGSPEVLITSLEYGNGGGKVHLYYSDQAQLLRSGTNPLLIEGGSGQHLGRSLSGGGDVDGDGLLELLITSIDKDMSGNDAGTVIQFEKRNFERLDETRNVATLDLDMDDQGRMHLLVADVSTSTHLERPNEATEPNEAWREHILATSGTFQSAMVVTSAGKAIILAWDGSELAFHGQSAHTVLSLSQMTTVNDIHDLDLAIIDEQSRIFYSETHNASTSFGKIRGETDSGYYTTVLSDNSTSIMAFNATSAIAGHDVGSSCMFSNGTTAFARVAGNESVITYYEEDGNSSTYTLSTAAALSFDIFCRSSSLLVAMQTLTSFELLEYNDGVNSLNSGSASVTSAEALIVDPTAGTALFASVGGGYQLCDASICTVVGSLSLAGGGRTGAATGGDGTSWILHDGGNNIATVSILDGNSTQDVWSYRTSVTSLLVHADMEVDDAGVVRFAIVEQDGGNHIMTSFRIHPDWDRDFVPSPWDDVPNVGGQWNDVDNDGYGDNPDGAAPDTCPSAYGTSRNGLFGCTDTDADGYANSVDDCTPDREYSFVDRQGCVDADADGWSNNIESWIYGDEDPTNWMQARDDDGDGRMNNHGPDCCGPLSSIDEFPHNGNQWEDLDDDGWGDESAFVNGNETSRDGSTDWSGDQCLNTQGFSRFDRGGCLDSDGDGWSDPTSVNGSSPAWVYNRSQCHAPGSDGRANCADKWPDEPTQWHDRDGDGYGDNGTLGAWQRDRFPDDYTQWNDSDDDGYGDNQTGTTPDACPASYGTSTVDRLACPDSDGDGWSDPDSSALAHPLGNADSNASNPDQWRDTDGDGFGDFSSGANGDQCPNQFGYLNGELGRGCPLPANDSDGDGIIDDDDQCANTTIGESVDTTGPYTGCSEMQKDDDGDGVPNAIDQCANTTAPPEEVDEFGCSEDQSTLDSDSDGVYDLSDACPDTAANATVDVDGCAPYQLDSDGDEVPDDVDICPDTPQGAQVDAQGCPMGDVDTDSDGHPDNEDAFPVDPSQWGDYDADGYGDEPPPAGYQGDSCPSLWGNSTIDRFGCEDTDGDGYSDPQAGYTTEMGADAFPNNPNQWSDIDGDRFGDNPSGDNPDDCPTEAGVADGVRGMGCPAAVDSTGNASDDCTKYYDDFGPESGYPGELPDYVKNCAWAQTETEEQGLSTTMIIGGAVGGFVLLLFSLLLVMMLRRRGDDYDDEDDDMFDMFDDDYDTTPRRREPDRGMRGQSRVDDLMGQSFQGAGGFSGRPDVRPGEFGTPRGDSGPQRRPGPSPRGQSGPPQRSGGPPSRGGPPGRTPSGPDRAGPPGRAKRAKKEAPAKAKKVARKVAPEESTKAAKPSPRKVKKTAGAEQKPVRKTRTAKQKPATQQFSKPEAQAESSAWEDLFQGRDEPRYNESLAQAREMLADDQPERSVLRQLQEDGWTSRQSRWILDAAQMR